MKESHPLPIRVISHNIRYAPIVPSPGEARWLDRLPFLSAQLQYHTSFVANSIICMQEVLHHQLTDLLSALNADTPDHTSDQLNTQGEKALKGESEWTYIGVGRDDGHKAGEYVPIFYRSTIWELREHTVEWLSPKPKRKGWDAGSIRIVTIAILAHRGTQQEVLIMNTHLDNEGIVARRESAKMLVKLAQQWRRRESSEDRITKECPTILTGDLNSDEQGEAYQIIEKNIGHNTGKICKERAKYGEKWTFTGFQDDKSELELIDFIFVGPREKKSMEDDEELRPWNTKHYAVLPNRFEDSGVYSSDHRAVVVDLQLSR